MVRLGNLLFELPDLRSVSGLTMVIPNLNTTTVNDYGKYNDDNAYSADSTFPK